MKIINLIKRNLLGFIAGAIIFGSIGAYALTVASKDVTYNNTNVESAINDLYSKVSNSSGNTKYKCVNLAYNTTTDTIHFEAGDVLAIQGVGVYNNHYREASSSTWSTLPNTFTNLATDGTFTWLTGHNYGGSFLCVKAGNYIIRNDAYGSTAATMCFPDR